MLLSGGIDSYACLDFYRSTERPLCVLHLDYGQAAAVEERHAAEAIAMSCNLPLHFRRLDPSGTKGSGEIPGRNAFLVSVAVMERPPSVMAIALGIHGGTDYPDCSQEFLDHLNAVLRIIQPSVQVVAPFIDWQKADILAYCEHRRLSLELTYSCEAGGQPCGRCFSCLDRREIDARA